MSSALLAYCLVGAHNLHSSYPPNLPLAPSFPHLIGVSCPRIPDVKRRGGGVSWLCPCPSPGLPIWKGQAAARAKPRGHPASSLHSAHRPWGRISSSEPLGNQLSPPSTLPASRPHICPLALFFPRNSQNTLFEHYIGSFYTLIKILPGFPLMRRQEGGTSPRPVVSALSVTRSHPEPPCVTVTRGSLLPVLVLLGGLVSAGGFSSGDLSCAPLQRQPLFPLCFSLEYLHLTETS